jgi:hypothetical protein
VRAQHFHQAPAQKTARAGDQDCQDTGLYRTGFGRLVKPIRNQNRGK